jgi:predicted nucleic-acid-binding protein
VIGLDTNVLARYYVDDAGDPDTRRQRESARRLIESGRPLAVAKTVLLELEWVLRGFYGFEPAAVLEALSHICALPQVEIEDAQAVAHALAHYRAGLDFADALHQASYAHCVSMASFDDRRFARRANRIGALPRVSAPR